MNTRLFSRYRYENKYLDRYLTDTMKKDKKLQWYLIKVNSLQDLAMLSLLGVMLALLLVGRAHQQVTVGDFAFILSLSASIFESLWQVTTEFVTFSEQWGTCQQGLNILLASHDMRDKAEAQPLEVTEGVIEFKEVCFGYRTPPLFDKLSLNIRTGEKVGLVGASGSGKTTFTNLILRLYDISSGHITIDGQDIANVTRESLRRQISLIPQEPNLFHRTLMENIRYARLDATNEEVIAAAKKAHCHDFIEELEEGYDTVVGERGLKLSGGQRQLISIARAILKGAPIVIFDEASSALDSVTERYIQDSLDDFMRNRTAVVIAHRLGTLRSMDRILVFKQGRIIEQGTHESLLKQNGEYYRLWESQTTMPDKSGDGGSVVVDEVY